MNPADKVDKEKAMNQWNNLKATIEKSGAIVDVLEPNVSFCAFLGLRK